MKKSLFLIILLFFISSISLAANYGAGKAKPLPNERLANPLSLSDRCINVKIVEWKPTPKYESESKLNYKSYKAVNDTCNLVMSKYYTFIKSKKRYSLNKNVNIKTSLSFLPADIRKSGTEPRNLNDIKYRFKYRADQDALWGWYQRKINWVFIRNDVFTNKGNINSDFILVTAHEIFHALNYVNGIYHQHKPSTNRDNIEEKMAEDFTEYLGLGR